MLGKLVQLHKRCKTDKIKLKMCTISKNPLDVFKITDLISCSRFIRISATALTKY